MRRLLIVAVFFFSFILMTWAAFVETPTVDEYAHVPAGLSYWHSGDFALYSKNPPLLKLWMTAPLLLADVVVPPVQVEPFGWGPWTYGYQFEQANFESYLGAFHWARMMIVLLTLATGALVWVWSRELFGEGPALVASAGFLLSPTVLAHGHLATTDMGCTFLITLSAFLLSRYRADSGQRLFAGAGLALGAALAAKFSAIFLVPWFLIQQLRWNWKGLGVAVVTGLLAVWASYGFSGLFPLWSEFHFYSQRFRDLPWPGSWRLPFPRAFIAGFDAQMSDAENGEFGNYLLGEHSASGWWHYNLVALVFKETPLTLLLVAALPFTLRRRFKTLLPVFGPLLCLGVPLVFFNPLQVGVRYLLPLFPFLFILMGAVAERLARSTLWVGAVGLWMVLALWTAPAFISYFNPLALIASQKEDLLLDSNLDWGQDLYRLKDFSKEHSGETLWVLAFGHTSIKHYVSEYKLVPAYPVQGWVIVSPNFVKGLGYVTPVEGGFAPISAEYLAWMRNLTPAGRLGSLLVYDLRK